MGTSSPGPAGPADYFTPSPLNGLLYGHIHSAALRAVAVHGIADLLADGPRTAEDLAASAGLHAVSLRRVLRLLAGHGLFTEDARGAFELTENGLPLRTDVPGSRHATILLVSGEMFGRAADGIVDTVRTGTPSFETAYGVPFFEHLAASPAERQLFDAGMAAVSGPIDDRVAQSYAFPGSGTVVDVGGGRGGLLRAVLTREPALTGVLFDRPGTVADHLLDIKEVRGRWSVEGGDFFSAVPSGGDIYLLKHVLHDWDDDDCARILDAIRRAADPGKRLLVIDAVLPEGSAPHPAVALDIAVMLLMRGRERTAKEFERLLSRTGFRLNRILPTPSLPSIIEAEAV
ncbi:methyltransferase [Streptomyces sp. NPDC094438]|uniref:methyltransferase n=1 Tax=Streptomyces sp. NPDC094438 TaxID=3366061 RepID=UPI00380E7DA9